MPEFQIVLLDPSFCDACPARGDDLDDAIKSFWSAVWRQGSGADERVIREYGDYLVYERSGSMLTYKGLLKELRSITCKHC